MACYGNLLALCAKALASYDSEYSEVDTHLEEFLSLNNNDVSFVCIAVISLGRGTLY